MTKKLAAEFIGTFTLVLLGCGSAVLAGFGVIGQEGIAWAFGFTFRIRAQTCMEKKEIK